MNKKNLILGLTGSVATIKAVPLLDLLTEKFNVTIVATDASYKFISQEEKISLESKAKVYTDKDEWEHVDIKSRQALHIELRKWADCLLIAPCSANTLAKIANGLADNLLTSIIRAWDYNDKSMFIAPAMNTMMWDNPFTKLHLNTMKEISKNVFIIDPIAKKLFCGDIGMGAMAEIKDIAFIVQLSCYNPH
ncbi:hypothetical protein CYY_002572 [Polysphondylium violaceum]|uniref:Flavoprotein domain-containing protein n=1 Tax=Polysphondylium violaceum TaxID=133409 RepID=A0A8J4V0R0_9MYCE|nr:hypothetical protein CYY_002572 [Polysphondylium violaceum]